MILVDEPVDAGGEDTGPQPTEIFLASVASCFALAVAHVARKRSVDLPELQVRAVGQYDGPRFVNVLVEVATSAPRADVEPLLEKAASVCYVSNTLRAVDDVDVVLLPSPNR